MIKIRLFCSAGMSTSLLVSKMKDAAKAKGLEVDIEAFPEAQMERSLENVNVVLLGPQVGYTIGKAKKICEPKGIPVDVIPMVDYGMMNGAKVLDFAIKLAGNK
ncbi:phosphotransferase system lactose/cellobiose-specific IIB subunit [Clostridium sp. DL-VIII]|uniref:PTS sugar transporter subunit IIB n=1 Tax=Clostridium sp. DL-VIII TaxID=641107 RepID=UPI00023AFFA0|nr:PTS sugar transporter subunit IIB [Clostridium sp. DL-VIII]EHI99125.1 phosphotransferase system lactose/cellobiose-specific IIB subunit [Clostridium sp. DL-VIII]